MLLQFGEKFTTLVDMVYPYVIRTLQDYLAQWTSIVDYPVWQLLAVVLIVLVLTSLVLVVLLKRSLIQWLGWVLAVCSGIFMLHTMVWGLSLGMYHIGIPSLIIVLRVHNNHSDHGGLSCSPYQRQS